MTLGEWLNSMIMDEPEEDDSVATLPRRSPIPDPYDRRSRSRRLDDVYGEDAHRHEGLGRMGASLEVIAERLEAAERRSTLAIQGIDQAVVGLVRRMEAQDEAEAAKARRIDDIAEELREGHRRLRRLEQDAGAEARDGLDKLDAALTAVSTRLYEMDERQRAGVSELRDRIEAVEKAAGPGAGTTLLSQVGVRLDDAQSQTSEALKGLERSFAALDLRMRDAERRIEPDHAREASRFEKLAEALTRQVESSRVEMMRRLDVAETEGRVERIERALAAIGEQARAAEQRSVAAVEGMGHEIMRIARNLNGRVEKVEAAGAGASDARVAALEQKLERDLARHAQAVDQRLTQADDQHALALERLGGEIARISDRLGERIAQSERRSAQALDDIGRRLAESTDKMHQRHERASGDLAERMRQSEERTARLLAEARDSIEQRAGRAERRDVPLESPEPAPWTPAESPSGDWRAAAFADPVEPWSQDPLAGAVQAEPFPTEPERHSDDGVFVDPFEADFLEPARAATPFGRAPVEPSAESPASHAPDAFGGADISDILAAFETPGADVFARPESVAATADHRPLMLDGDDDGFAAELEFVDPAPRESVAEEPTTTRDVLDAARAAMAPDTADDGARAGFGLKKRGGKSKLQERLDKQAGRQGSTMRKAMGASAVAALVVGGGYASLQVAEGAGLRFPGVSVSGVALGPADAEAALDTPIAALALDATPTEAVPSPEAAATEGASLFARASLMLNNGDEAGVEPLTRAANLGYAPAQLRLAMLYQDGQAGLAVDDVEARAWARRAAEGGDAKAMHHYAMQLYDGIGGAKSGPDALTWLKKAAEAGRVDSQYNVAKMLEQGDEGVAANRTEAFKWYMIAARRGDQQALASVQRLTPALSAVERRKAREAADAFTAPPLA
ncbi:SEL1-like repeat protein [Brevundimonas sp. Sa3CVA3]|uniref:SEL1-like repeat protein n=2 Tax=Brevundimonas guildfordensis TaxID=2762241 RepID=A0ABR8R3Y3_9CAUL|nr:SEL1-like repeat protein [Brevundimonas guildfordensis]